MFAGWLSFIMSNTIHNIVDAYVGVLVLTKPVIMRTLLLT